MRVFWRVLCMYVCACVCVNVYALSVRLVDAVSSESSPVFQHRFSQLCPLCWCVRHVYTARLAMRVRVCECYVSVCACVCGNCVRVYVSFTRA